MAISSISDTMLNFRKLKQDFSAPTLREGKLLHEKKALLEVKIVAWGGETVDISAKVKGQFNDFHSCHLELFRVESDIAHSKCDCINSMDCQHIACVLFHLENHFPELLVQFLHAQEMQNQQQADSPPLLHQKNVSLLASSSDSDKKYSRAQKKSKEHLEEIEEKSKQKVREKQQQQQVGEYLKAGQWLSKSLLANAVVEDLDPIENAEMIISVGSIQAIQQKQIIELQICIKTPGRAKPILLQNPKFFFQALYLHEPLVLGSSRSLLTPDSFGKKGAPLCFFLRERGEVLERQDRDGRAVKVFTLSYDDIIQFFSLLFETQWSNSGDALISIVSDFIEKPSTLLMDTTIRPTFHVKNVGGSDEKAVHIDVSFDLPDGDIPLKDVKIFAAKRPFLFYNSTFYLFDNALEARHILELESIGSILFPEMLFSTFFQYTLPSLEKYGSIIFPENLRLEMRGLYDTTSHESSSSLIQPKAHAQLSIGIDSELMLELSYSYGGSIRFPEIQKSNIQSHIGAYFSKESSSRSIPRNFLLEKVLAQEIGWGMNYDDKSGLYQTKSEKKILEFFSDVLPYKLHDAEWIFDETIEDLFVCTSGSIRMHIDLSYDTKGSLPSMGGVSCLISMHVDSALEGISADKILQAFRMRKFCIDTERVLSSSERAYGLKTKQLIISPEEMKDLSELIQDTFIPSFQSGTTWSVPLWVIFGLEGSFYPNLDLSISKSKEVEELIASLSESENSMKTCSTPIDHDDMRNHSEKNSRYSLRSYQQKGVDWMKKMRFYGLSGVLADDMGLGKTLQTIVLLKEVHEKQPVYVSESSLKAHPSIIICPTSLVENWKSEIEKFEPSLKILLFSGTPVERKKLSSSITSYDIVITSYGVLQREIDLLEKTSFSYVILDEAQTIKNRDTRNARSVKRLNSSSRLVLTGTPLENSLEDIWSLFDFLMPGFLGCFERFSINYIRPLAKDSESVFHKIRKKIQPFVLRRMKEDVLDDLPSITHQTYFSILKEDEKALYNECAKKAKEEIEAIIVKDGFDKARLHILATISRLKQICCHPKLLQKSSQSELLELHSDDHGDAISSGCDQSLFESVSSASKYELLQELIHNLIASNRKIVVFSQYTRMLNIIKKDFEMQGISHLYLDGSTKNRLQVVTQFNEDPSVHVFLVSLKAGGTGLNLVGADTVIHYDPWWNPAVENQATDRVWRMGQKMKVSSYKLIVKGTIEENIANLQDKKRGLIGSLIQSDEEALSRLTYEDVMALFDEGDDDTREAKKRSRKNK